MYLRMSNIPFNVTTDILSKVRFLSKDLKQSNLTSDPTTGWTPSNMYLSDDELLAKYRPTDLRAIKINGCYTVDKNPIATSGKCSSVAYFDIQSDIQEAAKMSMVKAAFVMFVLVVSSISFVRVARKIVLDPIERMVIFIKMDLIY